MMPLHKNVKRDLKGLSPFAIRLRQLREDKGLTLAVIAKNVGVTVSFLSGLERGVYGPSGDTLVKLAAFLQVDPDSLAAGRVGEREHLMGKLQRIFEKSGIRQKQVETLQEIELHLSNMKFHDAAGREKDLKLVMDAASSLGALCAEHEVEIKDILLCIARAEAANTLPKV